MRARTSPTADIALVAVFAALIAAFSLTPAIPVGLLGVPITLQTLAVLLTGMVLGPIRGFLATLLYVVVGLAGMPVFAGGLGGPAIFVQPSVGYLLSFPFAAALAGWLTRRSIAGGRPRWWRLFAFGVIGSLLVIHPAGIVGMSAVAHLPLVKAAAFDLVFWPGDIIKSVLAAVIAVAVHRAFPTLLAPPMRQEASTAEAVNAR